jgi:5-methylcytosine-specific restriction endonuclease McrBC regulatory subunit McrC
MKIDLTDNNGGVEVFALPKDDVRGLSQIANRTLSDLCKVNKNLLIFPFTMSLSDDKIGDTSILSLSNESEGRVTLRTGNIMGFVGIGNLQLNIKSRFDSGRADYFLHYMLQRVLSFNIFDLNHSSEHDDILDMMMFLFPCLLKTAMRQGIYREYQHHEYNDTNLKGSLDANRHLRCNPIFNGNVAYSTREYSLDNSMTELIRHTIEFMNQKRYGRAILNIDSETIANVASIVAHTSRYDKNNRNRVIQKNLRSKIHPYYTEYQPLQSLCMQILRMEEVKYGESEEEIYGILFDGAWLWEEYVNTILCHQGFHHPENKNSKGAIYLFKDERDGKSIRSGRRYPDFYKEGFVLDAKYKRLDSYDRVARVDRNDIHQVMAYMMALSANRGGFVAPLTVPQVTPPTSHIQNTDATVSIFGIEVSKEHNSYSAFCTDMKVKEQTFVSSVSE